MYVTTFYSFKGGVGRTMALVNVAVALANRGRRVLAVDFDLDAPALDTFDVMRPREQVPGIIDFVNEYLVSGQAPDVQRFIGEAAHTGGKGGGLWIMPSARRETYSANFHHIDWRALYDERDGYLLFEDLKEQWRRFVEPDYVLIDSCTGHTDAGGICTRQLPRLGCRLVHSKRTEPARPHTGGPGISEPKPPNRAARPSPCTSSCPTCPTWTTKTAS